MRELANLRARSSWRYTKNTIMTYALGAAVVAVAVPLALVVWSVLSRGAGVIFITFASRITVAAKPAMRLARTWGAMGRFQMSGIAAEERDGNFLRFRRDQSRGVQSVRSGHCVG